MRLFTGLDLPPEVIRTLAGLLDELRPAARLKWSPPANLHITTRFIGEWPEDRLPALRAALAQVRGHSLSEELAQNGAPAPLCAFEINIRNLGFFPNPHSPRIFWTGVEAPAELALLAAETDRVLEPLGLKPEGRPFKPHLTLARIKEPVPLQKLRETIAALPSLDFGSFNVDRFFLYQSRLSPSGSVYSHIAEFPLHAAVS